MMKDTSLVITSIAGPDNRILQDYAIKCKEKGIPFIVIGDSKSPAGFHLDSCDFYSLERQKSLPFKLAAITPERHYSRKNLGYLLAASNGSELIIETDDDNYAMPAFWDTRLVEESAALLENAGWVNLYHYFADTTIWPRGFALEHLQDTPPALPVPHDKVYCPVQQGLANENPDVDAMFRLIMPLPYNFRDANSVAIGNNTWCPFNSQNTTWFREAFMLLYLPSYCSFRMTDIWRSFVAQRICWENGWNILFHKATVWQERNEHNLMKDFADEIPGYMNNLKIADTLQSLQLKKGKQEIGNNLRACYQALVDLQLVGEGEMLLIDAWIADMEPFI